MRKQRGRILSLAVLAVSALMLNLAASGIQQKQLQQQPLRHDAAAVVKLVPVRVLDAEGKPVRGLKKENFVLRDNGELKAITEFEVYESGATMLAAAAAAEARMRPETMRKIFFVLDMQASDVYGNKDSKNAVLEYAMSQLKTGDEACVMTFGALTGLVLRQFLTSDLDKIKKAISRSIEMGGGGGRFVGAGGAEIDFAVSKAAANPITIAGEDDRRQAAGGTGAVGEGGTGETPFAGGSGIELDTAGGGALSRAARTKADFDVSMKELAQAMRYVPGTKSVIYFSTRVPGQEVSRLFAEANATIFAVNTGSAAGPSRMKEIKAKQGEALKDFAEASGGHYFADVKDAKTIAREVETLSGNYYVLGYYINLAWDGRLHQIKVDVDRPGVRVLAQAGYNDPTPYAGQSDLEKKLQLFDLTLSDTPVSKDALELPLEILTAPTIKEVNAAVLLKMAVDEKTGVPPGKTEIFTFIFDKERKIQLAERGEMDTVAYAGKTLYPYLLTRLLPGTYEVRVMARDMATGQSAVSRLSFAIPPRPADRVELYAPFLLVPGAKPEFVRMARAAKKEKEPLSIIRFYPFLPINSMPIVTQLPPGADKVLALVPLDYGTGEPAETDLAVRLLAAEGGEEIPIDWGLIDAKKTDAGKDFLLIGINCAGLKPGTYRLEFSLKDAKSDAKISSEARLVKK
jgi:VWFA-related protein